MSNGALFTRFTKIENEKAFNPQLFTERMMFFPHGRAINHNLVDSHISG